MNAVLLTAFVILLYMYLTRPTLTVTDCSKCEGTITTVIKHDTIYPSDTVPKLVLNHVPKPTKAYSKAVIHPPAVNIRLEDSLYVFGEDKSPDGNPTVAIPSPCDSIILYSDTIRQDKAFKAIINDTLENNHIRGRSVYFASLLPTIKETVTNTVVLKEKWKVYIGVAGTINARNFDRWGIGPDVFVSIPKIGGALYQYDVRNNAHTFGFSALLRFKK